jgi:molecular chaperone HtpG
MKTTQAFNAEIQELLNLVIHSLYSKKEIFLRELISNASDAIDKRKFEALTNPSLKLDGEYQIDLIPNKEEKTLKIRDNGIGMTKEEVVDFIGTIARSGTKKFIELHKQALQNPEFIGQFGVGFYSSFMVANRVVMHTQKAGSNEGVVWESEGKGEYSISSAPRPEGAGTTITLFLKSEENAESTSQDFLDEWTLKSLVKKYSYYIAYPIKLCLKDKEPETINSQKAIWQKNPSEVTEEEHTEFYRHISHDWGKPKKWWHWKAEGNVEFTSLVYIPEQKPWNYYMKDFDYGLSLYTKKVFIMDNNKDLLPPYLRFVKGLVDCSDLPLNVSREILQHDRQIQVIKKNVLNKILSGLKEMLEKDRPNYESFFTQFGPTLKEGIPLDPTQKDKIADLLLFKSSKKEGWIALAEYVSEMPPTQKSIYFLSGESLERVQNSPYLEKLNEKGFNVLFLTDPVDEWVTKELTEYKNLKMVSIAQDNLDLETEEEKKQSEAEWKALVERFSPKLEKVKSTFSKVKDIRLSKRLTSTSACLVIGEGDMSPHMQKILQQMGENVGLVAPSGAKRILELNPKHPLVEHLLKLDSKEQLESWMELLYYQAQITEGSPVDNPSRYMQLVTDALIPKAFQQEAH